MKYPLVIRVLQDALADKTRRKISPEEVSIYCRQLAEKVRLEYEPDLVVAIATGGSIPGELVAGALTIPLVHLTIRRDIDISRRYSRDPIPLRYMLSLYHHFLFQTTKPTISVGVDTGISDKKILIVDDALHTGATIDVAVEYLRKARASEIKTASLGYVSTRKPDFSALPRGNYSFPWSRDYIE